MGLECRDMGEEEKGREQELGLVCKMKKKSNINLYINIYKERNVMNTLTNSVKLSES